MPALRSWGYHQLRCHLTSKSQGLIKDRMTMPKFASGELHKIAVLFEIGNITAGRNAKGLTEMTAKMALIRETTLL